MADNVDPDGQHFYKSQNSHFLPQNGFYWRLNRFHQLAEYVGLICHDIV